MTPEAWARLKEAERETIAAIIRGRCRQVVEKTFTEFAELVMRWQPPDPPSTGKAT